MKRFASAHETESRLAFLGRSPRYLSPAVQRHSHQSVVGGVPIEAFRVEAFARPLGELTRFLS
jgi:hypothetical protein